MELTAPADPPTNDGPSRRAVAIMLAIGAIVSLLLYRTWFVYHVHLADERIAVGNRLAVGAIVVAAAILATWIWSPTHAALVATLEAVRAPGRRARCIASIAISLASAGYVYGTAVEYHRGLVPLWHDSNQHMVQAQLILHGKLWAAPHPLADQMETFFVLTKPVYAAIHFPGTSMLYAPLLALGVPPAVFSALMTGAIVGLMYRVTCELIDGVAGALVVPYILGLSMVREVGVMLLSHHMFLVPTLLAFWAYLRWRRSPDRRLAWSLAVGCFVAYAGIMRPVEALSYGVALAAVMAFESWPRGARPVLMTLACLGVGGSPWVTLQLTFNYNVTGHVLRPPYEEYVQRYHPNTSYGSYADPTGAARIQTNLPQKVDYYESFIRNWLERYSFAGPVDILVGERLPMSFGMLTPFPLAIALWLPGVLTLRRPLPRRVWVIAAVAFWAFYIPHVFFLAHYPVALVPVAAFLAVGGVHVIGRAFAGGRRSAEVLAALALVACGLAGLPEVNRSMRDSGNEFAGTGLFVNTRLAGMVTSPAAILSRYRTWRQPFDAKLDNPHDEPVYTIDALWPEDSPLARFQDLGPERNREIYDFFVAKQQGGRHFYLLDRRSQRLLSLGTATELAARGEPPAYFEYTPTTAPAKDQK